MHFLYQPLTWGFLLVLLPVIIHLINLMRQRRVDWAAMDFLLKAYRKHRKWIWMRQLLLLASRMLLVVAVVAMLAHLVTRRQWTLLFGDQTTHHFVLLDDSFSMSDRSGPTSAFDRGTRAVTQFAQRLMTSDVSQKLTLIRWSQAERAAAIGEARPAETPAPGTVQGVVPAVDINALQMDGDAEEQLAESSRDWVVSSTAAGPQAAIEYANQLVRQSPGEMAIVHLISDFRQRNWQQASDTQTALQQLNEAVSTLQLVDCVDARHENLAISDFRPLEGTMAAGVPVQVEVEVRNYGTKAAQQVPVFITTTPAGSELADTAEQMPALLIDEIPPGDSLTRQVQLFFPGPGQHVARAHLPDDAVAADNQRWCVIDLPANVPVLVIDGDPQQRNATYLKTVFQPSDRVATGISPEVRGLRFLTAASAESLAKYHAIYLFDVMRLDQIQRSNLGRYVTDGGGLGIFLGPNVDWQAYDEWYQGGEGAFPVALTAPRFLNAALETAGMVATDHPTMKVLFGDDNPFAAAIRFNRYFGIPSASMAADVEVIARLGNGQPILVERRFGQGRVMVMLSTLAPLWNNWATQPSFVVFLLEMQSYLDSLQAPVASRAVGTAIPFAFDEEVYRRELRLRSPAIELSDGITIGLQDQPSSSADDAAGTGASGDQASDSGIAVNGDSSANPSGEQVSAAGNVEITVVGPNLPGQRSSNLAGIYEIQATRLDGAIVRQRYALNVDPQEGDLALYDRTQFADQFGDNLQLVAASDVALDDGDDDRFSWSKILLCLLPILLIAEQLLGYSASYHPKRKGAV